MIKMSDFAISIKQKQVIKIKSVLSVSRFLNLENDIPSIFSNENELKFALTLLELKWRDSFLMGLIDCFMNNWDTKNQKSLEQIEQFGAKKLESYTGNRTILVSFKNNKRFFNTKNGDVILGDTIAKLNKPIQEATKILGVPGSWFNYPYFSKIPLKNIDSVYEL